MFYGSPCDVFSLSFSLSFLMFDRVLSLSVSFCQIETRSGPYKFCFLYEPITYAYVIISLQLCFCQQIRVTDIDILQLLFWLRFIKLVRLTCFSGATGVNVLMESKGGKKKSSSSSSLQYEVPLGYSIEDVRPHGGIKKFQSAAYSNVSRRELKFSIFCLSISFHWCTSN